MKQHTTLRAKASIYFASGFLALWILVGGILFESFKKAIQASFDDQLAARAYMIAEKTNVLPKIVPLPQNGERFTIIYVRDKKVDTLFTPTSIPFNYPTSTNIFMSENGWRVTKIEQSLENGGYLQVIFALPAEGISRRINQMELLIFLMLPAGFLLALFLAFRISNRVLKPVKQVINLANAININQDIRLLAEPGSEDELKDLVVSFNRMLLRIREQSNRQTAFFASASHELRTPLSVMHTRLEVLMQDQSNLEIKNVYAAQLREVQQLAKMVDDFLLMSELRSGDILISKTWSNLSETISDLIAKYKTKWVTRDLQFKISYIPVEATYEVFADELKLKIIFDNLFDNAIKYAPGGSVINILLQKNANAITISMTNDIRYDINPRISDVKNEFYYSKPLHGEGFGLGLWIANQLAVLQGIEMYFAIKDKQRFEASMILTEQ